MNKGGLWSISVEERRNYDQQFDQLGSVGGFVRGEQAKALFLKSSLPPVVLGKIWELADLTKDGKMDKKEFAIAMKLIKLKLQGVDIPKTLPPAIRNTQSTFDISAFTQIPRTTAPSSSSSVFSSISPLHSVPVSSSLSFTSKPPSGNISLSNIGSGGMLSSAAGMQMPVTVMTPSVGPPIAPLPLMMQMPVGMVAGNTQTMPNFISPVTPVNSGNMSSDWEIPKPSKLKYNQLFNTHDSGKTGFISGMQARFVLKQTGLPEHMLAQIWNLSDIDNDGKLTQEEFVLAMHLTDVAKSGGVIPASLHPNLIPPSYRRGTQRPSNTVIDTSTLNSESKDTNNSGSLSLFTTFEDKRRDNFNKGNIELERRRLALEESQRKERERLEMKEKEEREKRERERLEQERRKQAQLERQLELQRAAEQEKEEARKKAKEQREAAQREMERQRRLEFERLRRQELLQQKLREQEAVSSLHAKTKELDVEIAALGEKKAQLASRVSDLEAREKEQNMAINAMNQSLDLKHIAVSQRHAELRELSKKLNALQPEKQSIVDSVNNAKSSETQDTNSPLKLSCDSHQQFLKELRSKVEKNQAESASKMSELDKLNLQLNNLREVWNKHRLEVEAMHRAQQDKVRDLQEARRAKEASIVRKTSVEKSKRQEKPAILGESITKLKKEENLQNKSEPPKPQVAELKARFNNQENVEAEIKREDVKRRIAEMQQKRLEQKKLNQEPTYASVNKQRQAPVAANQSSEKRLSQFRALYAFEARNSDELTINSGDVVMVDENEDVEPGWYSGSLRGKKGLFPANYVEKVPAISSTHNSGIDSNAPSFQSNQQSETTRTTKSSPLPETIRSSDSSAFTVASRVQDASPVPGQGQQTYNLKCRALYPWQAKKDNHLTFEKDAVINVREQQAMWWFGTYGGKSGWFPKAYVKEIVSTAVNGQEKQPPSALKEAPSVAGKEHIASYNFASQEEGDLSFKAGDVITVTEMEGDWWKGTCAGRSGIFPANYVVPKESTSVVEPPTGREIADVIASYSASSPNQLSLSVGQLVLIKKKSDTGWWEGELQVRGKKKQIGWFPADYVKIRTPGPVKEKMKAPVCQVMAMYDYTAQNDDEISFSRGNILSVIDKSDADWWKGYDTSNPNSVGLFPNNYVREMSQTTNDASAQWTLQQKSMSPEEIRRQQHIHELIVSEESYLKDLEMANTGFQIPLREKRILTEQEMNTLFINWNELIMCSSKLMKAFRVRRKHSGDGAPGAIITLIGDVLCEQLPHLQPYVRFCSCQLKASNMLQEKIDDSPEFKKFVKSCESGTSFKGLPVSSYLVKPMQRITKYPLLIDKILKHTPSGHVDHNHLKLALERAEELCSQVNEGVREKENADRLEWLQSHINLEGIDKLVFNSATNCLGQRRFLHCGNLYKHKSNKDLAGFLFNDFLLLTTPTKPLSAPVNDFLFSSKSNPQFRLYKMPIFLNEVLVQLPTDSSSGEEDLVLFHLSHVDRMYTLRVENVNERTSWTSKIKEASQVYIETEKKKREKAYHARSQRTAGIGRLMVVIVEGCNLVKKNCGRNDPYCEVTMGVQSHATKILSDTTNPKWGTSMQFFIKDILQDVLCISVFQRDMFSPDDFLGRTELRVADIKQDIADNKGPLTKRLLLHEVDSGEVVVKVDLQLF